VSVYSKACPVRLAGQGHRPLKAEIIGSNPIRGTNAGPGVACPGTLRVMLLTPGPSLAYVIGLPAGLLLAVVAVGVGAWVLIGRISRG
jgi:hypothetical protein